MKGRSLCVKEEGSFPSVKSVVGKEQNRERTEVGQIQATRQSRAGESVFNHLRLPRDCFCSLDDIHCNTIGRSSWRIVAVFKTAGNKATYR
jgi:hypothetical protein